MHMKPTHPLATFRTPPPPLAHHCHFQTVAVSLRDVTEPQPLQLPHYGGELYVYVALVLGGLWLFTTAPLIIMLGVMVVSL